MTKKLSLRRRYSYFIVGFLCEFYFKLPSMKWDFWLRLSILFSFCFRELPPLLAVDFKFYLHPICYSPDISSNPSLIKIDLCCFYAFFSCLFDDGFFFLFFGLLWSLTFGLFYFDFTLKTCPSRWFEDFRKERGLMLNWLRRFIF